MLSAVLRSEIAIQVSIQIINAFVEMRKILLNHSGLIQRMDGLERKQIETEQKFERVFQALEQNTIPTQGIFFDGQVFDAYALCSRIIRSANKRIVLIDNYIDESSLVHLSKKREGVTVLLLTKTMNKQLNLDLQKAEVFGPTSNMVDLSGNPFTKVTTDSPSLMTMRSIIWGHRSRI